MKFPTPKPSVVFKSATVGFGFVPYTKPLAVTSSPPSEVTVPPDMADVETVLVTIVVEITGSEDTFAGP